MDKRELSIIVDKRELSIIVDKRGVEGALEVLPVDTVDMERSLVVLAAGLGLIIISTEHELRVISDQRVNRPASTYEVYGYYMMMILIKRTYSKRSDPK